MPYWHNMGNISWFGGVGMLVLMVLLAGLATVTVLLVRRSEPLASHDAALRILDERFARGEIDKEEYEQRRTALKQ
jgi:putative membrane protein